MVFVHATLQVAPWLVVAISIAVVQADSIASLLSAPLRAKLLFCFLERLCKSVAHHSFGTTRSSEQIVHYCPYVAIVVTTVDIVVDIQFPFEHCRYVVNTFGVQEDDVED